METYFCGIVGSSNRFPLSLCCLLNYVQRENAVDNFRSGKTWVLIATDVVARGMDFKGLNCVINYDFPDSAASYIHRVGELSTIPNVIYPAQYAESTFVILCSDELCNFLMFFLQGKGVMDFIGA